MGSALPTCYNEVQTHALAKRSMKNIENYKARFPFSQLFLSGFYAEVDNLDRA